MQIFGRVKKNSHYRNIVNTMIFYCARWGRPVRVSDDTSNNTILVEQLSIIRSRITAVVQTNLYLPGPKTIVSAYTNAALKSDSEAKPGNHFRDNTSVDQAYGLKKYDFFGRR